MKNFYYSTDLANLIKQVLDEKLPQTIKNINIGNFSLLPPPERIKDYIPAVFIEPVEVDTESANDVLQIESESYPYSIMYVAPYSFEQNEEMIPRIKESEFIANVLRSDSRITECRIEPSDTEAGGMTVYRKVKKIRFDNIATELFAQLKVPACVVQIEFEIFFRTFISQKLFYIIIVIIKRLFHQSEI